MQRNIFRIQSIADATLPPPQDLRPGVGYNRYIIFLNIIFEERRNRLSGLRL